MANQRQGVPAGWTWRATKDGGGRPRWIPSPALRTAGWKGRDLKDKHGQWLARGPSIDAADALVGAVTGWRAGQLVPAVFSASAPAGACDTPGAGAAPKADRLSLGALVLAWTGDPKADPVIPPAPEFAKLARATQRDYRGKLKRLLDVLAGYVSETPANTPGSNAWADYQAKLALVRAASIYTLEPREDASGMTDLLRAAYWRMHADVGKHQAHGVMAVASAWLKWCRETQSRTIQNWTEFKRETPPGRVRVATWEEFAHLVATADKMGKQGVADAMVLAVATNWSEIDVLRLTWPRVKGNRAITGADGRQKTGVVGSTPILSFGVARLDQIRERHAALKVSPTTIVHLPRQRQHAQRGPEADADYLRGQYAEVRAEAAKTLPSVASLLFADLRDTAFTIGREAGLSNAHLAGRTLQTLKSVDQLSQRHYGEITHEIGEQGLDLLETYIATKGYKL